jgi:AraC-like DNA-binding protein
MGRVLDAIGAGLLAKAALLRGRDGELWSRRAEILRFVEVHAAEPIGLRDLADVLHLSPSRTSHLVREVTGRSYRQLVLAQRLDKAKGLLRSSDLPISQVARLVGIDNECYFSRLFRRRTGRTPTAYRRFGPPPKRRPDIPAARRG